MVQTFAPVVHRSRQGWFTSIAGYAVGNLISASILGMVLATVGQVILARSVSGFLVGVISLAYALSEYGKFRLPRPQSHWQVPETWRKRYARWQTAVLYGLGLGVGFLTLVPFATYWVVLLWLIATGEPNYAAGVMSAFAVGRTMILSVKTWNIKNAATPHAIVWSDMARVDVVGRVNAFALLCFASLLVSSTLIRPN